MQKYHEAEKVLLGTANAAALADGTTEAEDVPKAAAGYNLLGRICLRSNRRAQALEYFRKSLEHDSFLWASYEALCQLGEKVDVNHMFIAGRLLEETEELLTTSQTAQTGLAAHLTDVPPCTPVPGDHLLPEEPENETFMTPPVMATPNGPRVAGGGVKMKSRMGRQPSSVVETPASAVGKRKAVRRSGRLTFNTATERPSAIKSQKVDSVRRSQRVVGAAKAASSMGGGSDSTPLKKSKTDNSMAPQKKKPEKMTDPVTPVTHTGGFAGTPLTPAAPEIVARGVQTRQASRISSMATTTTSSSTATTLHEQDENTSRGSNRLKAEESIISTKQAEQTVTYMLNDINQTCDTLRQIAEAYQLQHFYKCKEAIQIYQRLPRYHYHTGWLLSQLGRCYFEMVNYHKAVEMFKLARKLAPYRISGLECYSTALWHLKREVELSFLAQQVLEFDKLAPESWIVVGNCFSLQKEHETALKFFRRAIQLDPWFAYAYTLSAHEYVANEDFDKAVSGYRWRTPPIQ